ncbi:MAG: hypothetical protein WAL24_09575 [Nitrososphaeraceae archaeon]
MAPKLWYGYYHAIFRHMHEHIRSPDPDVYDYDHDKRSWRDPFAPPTAWALSLPQSISDIARALRRFHIGIGTLRKCLKEMEYSGFLDSYKTRHNKTLYVLSERKWKYIQYPDKTNKWHTEMKPIIDNSRLHVHELGVLTLGDVFGDLKPGSSLLLRDLKAWKYYRRNPKSKKKSKI